MTLEQTLDELPDGTWDGGGTWCTCTHDPETREEGAETRHEFDRLPDLTVGIYEKCASGKGSHEHGIQSPEKDHEGTTEPKVRPGDTEGSYTARCHPDDGLVHRDDAEDNGQGETDHRKSRQDKMKTADDGMLRCQVLVELRPKLITIFRPFLWGNPLHGVTALKRGQVAHW